MRQHGIVLPWQAEDCELRIQITPFDTVYPEGASGAQHHLQTTLVPAGGATTVELTFEVPGTYVLVDHSLSQVLKGAVGAVLVEGPEAPDV